MKVIQMKEDAPGQAALPSSAKEEGGISSRLDSVTV